MLLISGRVCPLGCVVGLELVWVIGYRGGGGRTLWISMVRHVMCALDSEYLQHGAAEAEAES